MSMTINKELPNPAALKAEFPVPEHIKEIKAARDKEIAAVFRGESDKFLVIVGPCSADNEESVCEYTRRLPPVAAHAVPAAAPKNCGVLGPHCRPADDWKRLFRYAGPR